MQNTAQKFRQSPIIFEKPGILPENFNELQLPYSSIFFTETLNTFSTYQCLKKGVWEFLKFCLDLELFAKIKKDLVSAHSFFTLLLITQDLNKIKKSHTPFCRHY